LRKNNFAFVSYATSVFMKAKEKGVGIGSDVVTIVVASIFHTGEHISYHYEKSLKTTKQTYVYNA